MSITNGLIKDIKRFTKGKNPKDLRVYIEKRKRFIEIINEVKLDNVKR